MHTERRTIMATKTVTLNGAEQRVDELGGLNALIINNTTEALYASAKSGVVPYADGVIEIKAGASRGLPDANGTVYLLGSGGRAEITGTSSEVNFSVPSTSDEDDGELKEYIDAQNAKTLEAAKEYGNELFAGIPPVDLSGYYTSSQTDALLGGKANKADIPSALPANGGNAATVNGHTVNSDVPSNAKFTDTVYTHPTTSGNKHIPAGGSNGQILRWSADGTAVWGADNNTTYANMKAATASAAGAQAKFLRGDGTWQTPPDTNTTYGDATASASGLMNTGAQTFGGSKTFNGSVVCAGASAVGTAQARNIYAGTDDLTAGASALTTGAIYIMYE